MSDPKPERMWACYDAEGCLIMATLARHHEDAVDRRDFILGFSAPDYPIYPVTITPDHESENER